MSEMKTMSVAYQQAQEYRDLVNQGRVKLLAKDLSCVVYLYENRSGQPCAIGYRGRAKRPSINYRYRSEEERAKRVSDWMTAQASSSTRRRPEVRQLEVGDVLRAMWGYDQTNIDYYKVTQLIGKTMVELIEIGQIRKETDWMQGDCVPDPNKEIGEPMRKRVDGTSVRIDKVRYASKIEPTEVAGAKVYGCDHWSSYH